MCCAWRSGWLDSCGLLFTGLYFFIGGKFDSPSSDLRFFPSLAPGTTTFGFWEGGEDEDPMWNLRLGSLGFFASSSRRLQSWQTN